MPGFETHIKRALPISILIGFMWLAYGSEYNIPIPIILFGGVMVIIFGLIGASSPDIDHQDSKPRRYVGAVALILVVYVIDQAGSQVKSTISQKVGELESLVVAVGFEMVVFVAILAAMPIIGEMWDDNTVHRRKIHSIWFATLLTGGTWFFTGHVLPTSIEQSEIILFTNSPIPSVTLLSDFVIGQSLITDFRGFLSAAVLLGVLSHLSEDGEV